MSWMGSMKRQVNDTCPKGTPELRVSLLAVCMYMPGWGREGEIVPTCVSSSEILQLQVFSSIISSYSSWPLFSELLIHHGLRWVGLLKAVSH